MSTADKGARLANAIIDSLLIFILILLFIYMLYFINPSLFEKWHYLPDIIYIIIFIAYYLLFEGISGRTPGKWLTKTKVTGYGGNRPGLSRIFARTLLRMIPLDLLSFLFGSLGLHDLLSRTTVVHLEKPGAAI